MSSLREIKGRIASVRSTLKITSAMKLVSSSKLRKAQRAVETLRPYEAALGRALAAVSGTPLCGTSPLKTAGSASGSAAAAMVIAIAGNSSLCGGFNANAYKKALEVAKESGEGTQVLSIGRKMAESMKKAGYPCEADYSRLVGHTSYEEVRELSSRIVRLYEEGRISRVLLVYNHFVSTSSQVVVCEQYLPYSMPSPDEEQHEEDYIIEPGARAVAETLLPQVLSLMLYAAILDSVAAEHAARTVAMQTASDNAEDLLSELTLEYNKGRQQKITSELLDIVGGSMTD